MDHYNRWGRWTIVLGFRVPILSAVSPAAFKAASRWETMLNSDLAVWTLSTEVEQLVAHCQISFVQGLPYRLF